MYKFILNSIFLLLASFGLAQTPKVTLTVTPNEVSVNQPVSITIRTNEAGTVVENFPSSFAQGYGYEQRSEYNMDQNTGKMEQIHYYIYTGVFTKDGSFNVGPCYIKVGSKSYQSNVANVTVAAGPVVSTEDFSAEQLAQPAFGIIERNSDKIYEGQALVLNSRVFSTFRPTGRPITRKNYEVDGAFESYPLDATSRIYIEQIDVKGKEYQTFAYNKQVIFPTGAGHLAITPYEIILPYGAQGFKVQSNVPKIEVLPLPADPPKDFIGAVGSFDVNYKFENIPLKQGDVFKFDVIVEGSGNLHNIEQPKLQLQKGMIVYGDPVIEEAFEFGSRGATGKVKFTYNIQVTKEGPQTIPNVSISYFDPELEAYQTKSTDSQVHISVERNDKFVGDISEEKAPIKDELAPIHAYTSNQSKDNFLFSISFWIATAIPLSLALLFIFLSKKREESKETKKVVEKQKIVQSTSKDYLNQAKVALSEHDTDAFYFHLEKGLTNWCLAKGRLIDDKVYTRAEMYDALSMNGMNSTDLAPIKMVFNACDSARYGLQGNHEEQSDLLNDAQQIIS